MIMGKQDAIYSQQCFRSMFDGLSFLAFLGDRHARSLHAKHQVLALRILSIIKNRTPASLYWAELHNKVKHKPEFYNEIRDLPRTVVKLIYEDEIPWFNQDCLDTQLSNIFTYSSSSSSSSSLATIYKEVEEEGGSSELDGKGKGKVSADGKNRVPFEHHCIIYPFEEHAGQLYTSMAEARRIRTGEKLENKLLQGMEDSPLKKESTKVKNWMRKEKDILDKMGLFTVIFDDELWKQRFEDNGKGELVEVGDDMPLPATEVERLLKLAIMQTRNLLAEKIGLAPLATFPRTWDSQLGMCFSATELKRMHTSLRSKPETLSVDGKPVDFDKISQLVKYDFLESNKIIHQSNSVEDGIATVEETMKPGKHEQNLWIFNGGTLGYSYKRPRQSLKPTQSTIFNKALNPDARSDNDEFANGNTERTRKVS
eukprot:TRINITY_DN172_c1_g1_i2.p1 TRINITY_DN172_c1_g1~~TRINITY_DN172_c1_g1_i2.p1  ORF type:complete len:426 (+),score=98.95 TRINITY_DN172_c1_g1_i2:164-1441(+)